MSYTNEPVTPAKVRPSTVSVSSYLLYLIAALQVLSAVLAFAFVGDMQAVYEDAFADVEGGETVASITSGFVIGATIFGLLVAAGLVVLAIFNNRGKNPSRITTWVVGAIFLCCGGVGLLSLATGGMNFGSSPDPDMPSNSEIQEMLKEALPSWYNAVSITLSVVGVLGLLVALILLALPPSNEFFRKVQPEWQPPAGAQGGYLAYPAYPAPGAPPAGPGTGPSAPAAPPAPPAAPPAPPAGPDDRPGGGS